MSNFKLIKKDIEAYLNTNWTTTKIQYPNARFEQPDSEYIRLSINYGDTDQISMGASQDHRTVGIITIAIFSPSNVGAGKATEYGDTLIDLFTGKTIGSVQTRSPTIEVLGLENNWFQIQVQVPFYSNRVVTS